MYSYVFTRKTDKIKNHQTAIIINEFLQQNWFILCFRIKRKSSFYRSLIYRMSFYDQPNKEQYVKQKNIFQVNTVLIFAICPNFRDLTEASMKNFWKKIPPHFINLYFSLQKWLLDYNMLYILYLLENIDSRPICNIFPFFPVCWAYFMELVFL